MIEIILYKNGFEIKGHSDETTCGEVSILSWAYASTIYRLDSSSKYYTNDKNAKKHNSGYTGMTFDINNFMANWMYEEFAVNLKEWAKKIWGDKVLITEARDKEFKKEEV